MPILGSFHHVHIISEDPEAAAEWYAGVFGAEITASVERRGARNVSLRLGEAALNIRGIRETDIIGQVDKHKPLGIHHFGFIVEDLEEMLRRIEEHGGKLADLNGIETQRFQVQVPVRKQAAKRREIKEVKSGKTPVRKAPHSANQATPSKSGNQLA